MITEPKPRPIPGHVTKEEQQRKHEDALKELQKLAKPGCKNCHGNGIYGWMTIGKVRSPLICACVSKNVKERARLKKQAEAHGKNLLTKGIG